MNKDVDAGNMGAGNADAYERLLSALADDAPAEWDADREAFAAGEPLRFAPLQELSRIAEFHRALQRAPHGSAVPEPAEWGPLLLLERLALGARSEVWRAWDPALRREVALKLIDAGKLSGPAAEGALLDEARAAARVSHPHVVVVHGVARHGERVGLWMELVRGQSLDAIVRRDGALPAAAVARLGADLAAALAAAHAAGVLHRDLKPANVIRDPSGRWVLVDFGLGLSADRRDTPAHASAGTPMYLAPEIFRGGKPSESSDLYSLGLLLWFALTGADAFPASNVAERVRMAEAGVDPDTRRAARRADGALAKLIERAIARESASRWPGAAAFEQALRAWKPGDGMTRRAVLLPVAGVLAAALALAWFAPWREPERNPAPQAPSPAAAAAPTPSATYAVEAALVRRAATGSEPLADGARVRPGDRLSLQLRVSRPAYAYVLNEDERGERYLLFPQPAFDLANPLPADSALLLPGTIGGSENAWTVTSRGAREHFLVVVSPEPVAELEAELSRLPAPRAGRAVSYATVSEAAVERLRGVGGVSPVPVVPGSAPRPASAFDRFRSLSTRETGVSGVWVRQVVLENPLR